MYRREMPEMNDKILEAIEKRESTTKDAALKRLKKKIDRMLTK